MPASVGRRTIGGRPTPGRSVGRRVIHPRCSSSSRYRMTVLGECPDALINSVVVGAPYVAAERMVSAMSSFMVGSLRCVVGVWCLGGACLADVGSVSIRSFRVFLSAFGAFLRVFAPMNSRAYLLSFCV